MMRLPRLLAPFILTFIVITTSGCALHNWGHKHVEPRERPQRRNHFQPSNPVALNGITPTPIWSRKSRET